jgi:hypothetical protein
MLVQLVIKIFSFRIYCMKSNNTITRNTNCEICGRNKKFEVNKRNANAYLCRVHHRAHHCSHHHNYHRHSHSRLHIHGTHGAKTKDNAVSLQLYFIFVFINIIKPNST